MMFFFLRIRVPPLWKSQERSRTEGWLVGWRAEAPVHTAVVAQATAAENGDSSATSTQTAQTFPMVNGSNGSTASTNSTMQFAAPNSQALSASLPGSLPSSTVGLSQGAQGDAEKKTLVRQTSFEERLDAIVGNLDLSEARYFRTSLSSRDVCLIVFMAFLYFVSVMSSSLHHVCIIPSMNHLWAMPKVEEPQAQLSQSSLEIFFYLGNVTMSMNVTKRKLNDIRCWVCCRIFSWIELRIEDTPLPPEERWNDEVARCWHPVGSVGMAGTESKGLRGSWSSQSC